MHQLSAILAAIGVSIVGYSAAVIGLVLGLLALFAVPRMIGGTLGLILGITAFIMCPLTGYAVQQVVKNGWLIKAEDDQDPFRGPGR